MDTDILCDHIDFTPIPALPSHKSGLLNEVSTRIPALLREHGSVSVETRTSATTASAAAPVGDLGFLDSLDNFSAHPLRHQGPRAGSPKLHMSWIEEELAIQIAAVRERVVTLDHVDFMSVPPWNLAHSNSFRKYEGYFPGKGSSVRQPALRGLHSRQIEIFFDLSAHSLVHPGISIREKDNWTKPLRGMS